MALAKSGRLEEAERELRLLLGANPEDLRLRMSLGNVLLNRGEHASAAREFEAIAAAQPRHAASRLWLGSARILLGESEEAVAALRESIALEPGNPQAQRLLGAALFETSAIRLGANAVRTDLLAEAIRAFEGRRFDPAACRANALRFARGEHQR
ncbi:MAG: tetratricopeptide repeat protein, partial [Planctomycetota bacterium]